MKIDITDHHYIELHKKGYTIDMVVMLDWINRELSIDHIIKGSKKIDAIYRTMIRKGLVSEEGKITKIGIEILLFIKKKTNKKFEKPVVATSDFDEWWNVFPANDKFTIRGRSFGPNRSFKANKEGCRVLFNEMITNQEYTKEEIIKATEYDINLRKQLSLKKGSNQLKFLRNSHTYLLRKDFQGFIGMSIKKEKETTNLGSVDI